MNREIIHIPFKEENLNRIEVQEEKKKITPEHYAVARHVHAHPDFNITSSSFHHPNAVLFPSAKTESSLLLFFFVAVVVLLVFFNANAMTDHTKN